MAVRAGVEGRLRRAVGAEVAHVEAVAGAGPGGDGVRHEAPLFVEGEGAHVRHGDLTAGGEFAERERCAGFALVLLVFGLRRILRRDVVRGEPRSVLREGERLHRVHRDDRAVGGVEEGHAGLRLVLRVLGLRVLGLLGLGERRIEAHRHPRAVLRDHGVASARDDVPSLARHGPNDRLAVAPVGCGREGDPRAVVRDHGVLDGLEAHQVGEREGAFLLCEEGLCEAEREGEERPQAAQTREAGRVHEREKLRGRVGNGSRINPVARMRKAEP